MVAIQPASLSARLVRARFEVALAPNGAPWKRATESVIPLEPTPLDRQPSAYVQVAHRTRPRGNVPELRVRTVTTANALFVRLQWSAPRPVRLIDDVNVYADSCAVLFPADGKEAELGTMGSPTRPVAAWQWRAGTDTPFSVTATGLGTVERQREHALQARGRWDDGEWSVVFGHALDGATMPLDHGATVRVSFAVWTGVANERAGLKSHSPIWHGLLIG